MKACGCIPQAFFLIAHVPMILTDYLVFRGEI
jgi:hypothetical protein